MTGPVERGARSWQQRYLSRHAVWGEVSRATAAELRRTVDQARDERPIQAFLAAHPEVFAAALLSGHTRCVRSQVRLGAQHVPDFLLADVSSIGVAWTLVELETPTASILVKNGDFARQTRTALLQIDEWRNWIEQNGGYARRTTGLGLLGIRSDAPGLILVGRRDGDESDADSSWRRAQTRAQRGVSIHTYDWLLERTDTCATGAHARARLGFDSRS
jgi:hypothetical protein